MIDYSKFPQKNILCVDMKSFYASVSAVEMGLDPLTCYLAVVGNTERPGSVVLAASPALKRDFGIKTTNRLFEIPDDPRIHIVNPKMSLFLKVSVELTKLFHRYAPSTAIHTYSVDESFIDVTGLENLWGSPENIAEKIQINIKYNFGLPCTIGIGPNMLMAKLALDLESKSAPNGIAKWTYDDIQHKLWPVQPLSKMWGIGKRNERTLNSMGIFTVGQLARYDLKLLEKKFGIMGNQLFYHSWGVDCSELGAPILEGQVSFGKSQILLRDYKDENEIKAVVLEMCEEVARRTRTARKAGRTIQFGLGYSKDEFGGGFHRSRTIEQPTNVTMDIYKTCLKLMKENYRGETVRSISVSITKLVEDQDIQLSLFDLNGWKKHELGYTVDKIRNKFGSASILRAVSYTAAGTTLHRSKLVGGHKS